MGIGLKMINNYPELLIIDNLQNYSSSFKYRMSHTLLVLHLKHSKTFINLTYWFPRELELKFKSGCNLLLLHLNHFATCQGVRQIHLECK